jgi:putative sigma-54 modulation protein
MDITVTGRHIEITQPIREYAEKKLAHIEMDFPKILSAHFILEVDKYRHIAELVLHCGSHIVIEARDVEEDLYAALDKVVDKVGRQLHKYKSRIQSHRPRRGEPTHLDEHVLTHDLHEDEGRHHVVRTEQYAVKPMSVDEAVLQLELAEGRHFLVFLNADANKINVLYRRKSGDFGLIQPNLA